MLFAGRIGLWQSRDFLKYLSESLRSDLLFGGRLGLWQSNDFLKHSSDSLALRLLKVSFRGVSFLRRIGLVGVVWVRGARRGSGEKQVNGEVRGGGRLNGQILIGVSAWHISDSGRDGRSNELLSGVRSGSVALLPKWGFVCSIGDGHTGAGEKHVCGDERVGGKLDSSGPKEYPGEQGADVGFSDANRDVVLETRFEGRVELRFRRGFDTCSGGIHEGAGVLCVKDDVRDGASLGTDVAAVDGRDEATLTNDDRFDATVEASDG